MQGSVKIDRENVESQFGTKSACIVGAQDSTDPSELTGGFGINLT